jgi:membrane-bound lytic murein transglycosylase B
MRIFFQTFLIFLLAIGLQANADAASKKAKRAKSIAKVANHTAASHSVASYAKNAEAMELADAIAANENLDPAWVKEQIASAKSLPRVVQLMTLPPAGGKKNWALYRSRFVTPVHIHAGLAFWRANKDTLQKAEADFGVPPSIVLGILGVETIFGRNTGSFRVLDALATLSFNYPTEHPRREARVAYFRGELAQFLVLSKQMERDPKSYKGSYAGAMGWPQFMPSSWRKHAVDFDNDGRIDLWQSQADMIGSVANYFKAYGWKPNAIGPSGQDLPQARAGLSFQQAVVELENADDPVTLYPADDNFFVVTKYNNSYYYAAAVLDLGAAIQQAIDAEIKEITKK